MQNENVIKSPEYLSPSSANTFNSCPKKWKFKYVDKLFDPSSESALVGTFTHLILEHLCQMEPEERTTANAKLLARELWPEFSKNKDYQYLNLTDNDARLFRWQVWRATEGLWKIEDPKEVEIVSTEQKVTTSLDGVPFKGIIDRVDKIDNELVVTDYKSGKFPNRSWHADAIRQILLYAAALESIYDQRPKKARLLYLNQKILDVEVKDTNLNETKDEFQNTWSKVQLACRTENFDANPSALCGWCAFFEQCPQGKKELTKRFKAGKLKSTAPASKYFIEEEIAAKAA